MNCTLTLIIFSSQPRHVARLDMEYSIAKSARLLLLLRLDGFLLLPLAEVPLLVDAEGPEI